MNRQGSSGFTLIEVMIVVVIIAILASIAVPSYDKYVVKSRRAECTTVMLSYANALERQFTLTSSYLTGTGTAAAVVNIPGFAACPSGAANPTYVVALDVGGATTATTFRIRATPQGAQVIRDTLCGALTLTNTGVKGATASASTATTAAAASSILAGAPSSDLGRQCW